MVAEADGEMLSEMRIWTSGFAKGALCQRQSMNTEDYHYNKVLRRSLLEKPILRTSRQIGSVKQWPMIFYGNSTVLGVDDLHTDTEGTRFTSASILCIAEPSLHRQAIPCVVCISVVMQRT